MLISFLFNAAMHKVIVWLSLPILAWLGSSGSFTTRSCRWCARRRNALAPHPSFNLSHGSVNSYYGANNNGRCDVIVTGMSKAIRCKRYPLSVSPRPHGTVKPSRIINIICYSSTVWRMITNWLLCNNYLQACYYWIASWSDLWLQ